MAGIIIKAGNPIPLHLQLDDFEAGKFCRAVLSDDNGTDFQTVDLVDRGAGLYTNTAVDMPSKNVLAVYQVFEDAGFTLPSERDAGIDIFILDSFIPVRRDDKLIGVIESDVLVEGAIADAPLIWDLESMEIAAGVSAEAVIGEVLEQEFNGHIERL